MDAHSLARQTVASLRGGTVSRLQTILKASHGLAEEAVKSVLLGFMAETSASDKAGAEATKTTGFDKFAVVTPEVLNDDTQSAELLSLRDKPAAEHLMATTRSSSRLSRSSTSWARP